MKLLPFTLSRFQSQRAYATFLLVLMSGTCFLLSVFRVYMTGRGLFLFLNWNLFLALVPWALSSLVMIIPGLQEKKWVLPPLLFSWILFFPNAPYILTDLFHLRIETQVPVWYDLVLILSFAWTGLLAGLISLYDMETIIGHHIPKKYIPFISVFLLFLTGFGIYIGRYLRWNSWDILQHPLPLMYDIADRFIHPFSHPRTWAVTILMGLFLNMIYWSVKILRTPKTVHAIK